MSTKKSKNGRIKDNQWQRKTMVFETLERREMLAADLGESILDAGTQGDQFQVMAISEASLSANASTTSAGDRVAFAHYETPLTPTGVGDYDNNSRIDGRDFLAWQRSYQSNGATADGNDDGVVDSADLQLWASNYGKSVDQALSELAEERIDTMLSQVVGKLDAGINEVANQVTHLADQAAQLPLIGDRIADSLYDILESTLEVDVPEEGIRDYFESRGFQVEKIASAEDLLTGNLHDLLVLSYKHIVTAAPFTINADGTLGDPDGLHLALSGGLTVQPSLAVDFTFGVDVDGGVFIQEGSAGELTLIVDTVGPSGLLQANVTIPRLTTVVGTAGVPTGKHIIDSGFSLLVSDFDNIPNERLYLFDEQGTTLVEVLSYEDATDFHGTVDLQATLELNNPLNQLPDFVRSYLNNLTGLPENLVFTADVHFDVETGGLQYNVNRNSLKSFVDEFQNSSSIEDALFNLMLDKYAENNPIPESAQLFLGTEIPLLEKNVMDLLDVPRPVQYVLAPAAFRGQSQPDASEADGFKINFDLFSKGSLENLLNGNTYNILSVDIDQHFEKEFGSITVLPETLLFSYLGIVNATLELVVEPGFFIDVAMTMGIDSEDFYVVGDTPGSADSEPNLALRGSLVARGIAEADLLYLIDFARITVGLGLEGFGGLTFVSPNGNDPKMRLNDINSENIDVTLGVNALVDITGEVGLVDTDFKAEVKAEETIPIYRSEPGTSIADLQRKLDDFKDDLETEGRTAIYLGAATGEPTFVYAAAYLIYRDNQNLIQTARELVVEHGVDLIVAVRTLYTRMSASESDVINILRDQASRAVSQLDRVVSLLVNDLDQSIISAAQTVWGLTSNYYDLAKSLYSVSDNFFEVAKALYSSSGANFEYVQCGQSAV